MRILKIVFILILAVSMLTAMPITAAPSEHAALIAYREFLTTPQTIYLEIFDRVIPWEFEPSDIVHAELIDFDNDGVPELFIMLEIGFGDPTIMIPHIVVGYNEGIEVLFGRLAWIAMTGFGGSGELFGLSVTEDGQTYIVRNFDEADTRNDENYTESEYFALKNGEFVSILTVAYSFVIVTCEEDEFVSVQVFIYINGNEADESELFERYQELGIIEHRHLNFDSRRDPIILLHEIDRTLDPTIPAVIFAEPTIAGVRVNPDGEIRWSYNRLAYHIDGHNFFRLRDIAYLLNDTESRFDVSWGGENNVVLITTGYAYTAVGSYMEWIGGGFVHEAIPTEATILIDGEEVNLTAYHIDGNNFFMLRELGDLLGFVVDWDAEMDTILIFTDV